MTLYHKHNAVTQEKTYQPKALARASARRPMPIPPGLPSSLVASLWQSLSNQYPHLAALATLPLVDALDIKLSAFLARHA